MVAKTISNILDNQIVQTIRDRQSDITNVFNEVLSWWDIDLYSRKPNIAYSEDLKIAELDMAAYLFALVKRNAIIKLPTYEKMRSTKIKEGQVLTSNKNRHGKLVGVFANQKVFTFGVRVIDMNVITTDSVGDFRNFSITDIDGNFYDGWNNIEFIPTSEENKFTNENDLWENNTIYFNYFIHPNRWTSIYSQYYLITKMLIDRLKEESKEYERQIRQMLDSGVKLPPDTEKSEKPEQHRLKDDDLVSKKVKTFETELITPENNTEYPIYDYNSDNLLTLIRKKKMFRYKIIPRLNFNIRATEFAFFNYGYTSEGYTKFPFWASDLEWEKGFRRYKEKKKWDKLTIPQVNSDKEISLLKRVGEKTEKVKEV